MKKVFIIILLLFIIFLKFDKRYDVRIELVCDNISAINADKIFAKDIKDNLAQIENLDEFVIFSKNSAITIYCRINPFIIDKKKVISIIERYIENSLYNKNYNVDILIDDDYKKKYDGYLVVSSDKISDKVLKKYYDDVFNRLDDKNITSKILKLIDKKRAVYIYYKDEDLQKYNINLSDIKKLIKNNNVIKNSIEKTSNSSFYRININSNINNLDDIKNIALHYKNKAFLTKLKDVFVFEDGVKMPEELYSFYNLENAYVLALSKDRFIPLFLFNFKVKRFIDKLDYPSYIHLDYMSAFNKSAQTILLDNSSSFEKSKNTAFDIQKKLKENNIKSLVLVGIDALQPQGNHFFEKNKNKIVIMQNRFFEHKVKNILDKMNIQYLKNDYINIYDFNLDNLYEKIEKSSYSLNPTTYRTLSIEYNPDMYDLADYNISKEDIADYLMAHNEGLLLGRFMDENCNSVDILLKNTDNSEQINIYSKDYKNFIFLSTVSQNALKSTYSQIVRKNSKFWAKLYK